MLRLNLNHGDNANTLTLTCGARIWDCISTDEMQTSRVTSYLSTNLLVSLVTWLITLSQAVLREPW